MEKFNFVRDGKLRLPPGFRFQPTDEELLFQYLKCKVLSWPLPASIIPELDVCNYDPWDLPGDMQQERYFFSLRETMNPNGKRPIRVTASGRWKATGVETMIEPPSRYELMGLKRTFLFYGAKPLRGSRTQWVMEEFHLVVPRKSENSKLQQRINPLGNWVLCRVLLKKGRRNRKRVLDCFAIATEGKIESSHDTSSSSPRSGITDVSSTEAEQCEESSSNGNA